MVKYLSADEAALLIKDGDTLGISALGLSGWPDEIGLALQNRFINTGHPLNLVLRQGSKTGDSKEKGTNRFAQEGMVKTWIAAHTGGAAKMIKLATENKVAMHCLPQGVVVNLWREIAAKRPGIITKVGLGTFIDPRIDSGCMNDAAKDSGTELVELISISGEEYLFYKGFSINAAIIRGTSADENGNISMEREGHISEALALAQATKNTGGIVIAQVEFVVNNGTLKPKDVRVPGIFVDYIVKATNKDGCWQTENSYYNPAFSGEERVPFSKTASMELDYKKVIARRCSMELKKGMTVNLGVGLPANISTVVAEEATADSIFITTEGGVIGGIPATCPEFGNHYNPDAMIDHGSMFDFYDGGGLDITFLGLAEADFHGNVNVSKYGGVITGPGGLINICQNTKSIVFCGKFTVDAALEIENGELKILKDGEHKKFVNEIEQITFSGKNASDNDKSVLYVTERAVFKLINGKMALIEVAPGVDIQKDVLEKMEFKPVISEELKLMDNKIFEAAWGELKHIVG
ncbi:MAG: acyl CoA:acetate/3-ketoacid CoA transferase [Eubacteriaceae bacterium]|nr:acyl CoA:acetate/3-ketoacid CoA transferase [Eubacteriaceae bacterium]